MRLTREDKRRVEDAIWRAEMKTTGEIRVHLRPSCGEDPMPEAKKLFQKFGMHKTKERNGVLIFVAWKSRRFAIVGDEGIHAKTGPSFWDRTRDAMAERFSKNDPVGAVVAGVESAGQKLKEHFPSNAGDTNELPNTISEGP